MGAQIEGAGLHAACSRSGALGGASHAIIPDRIEAGTFVVAGAITGGDIEVCRLQSGTLSLQCLPSCARPESTSRQGADRLRVRGAKSWWPPT